MQPLRQQIEDRLKTALRHLSPDDAVDPMLRPTQDAAFGDYQANCAMGLKQKLKANPRAIAERIIAALVIDDLCETPTIGGPGFINLKLRPAVVANAVASLIGDERLGIERAAKPQRVFVDFSSPNLAKEMHVGHLRSTIIGDSMCRALEFCGHEVHRINHLGDWGTQFGMLLEYVRQAQPEVLQNPASFSVQDVEEFYKNAHKRFEADAAFKEASRAAVVALQSGDPVMRQLWQAFCAESLRHCHAIYDRLDVRLEDRGESAYQHALPGIVAELRKKGLAVESEGALCVFVPGFAGRDDKPLPSIIQKSDGGYNYDTTDLAALRERLEQGQADRVVYVTDKGQSQHFAMIFAIARLAGWVRPGVLLEHKGFGVIQGNDHKRLRTRTGGTVKLSVLLDEAEQRALAQIEASEADPKRSRGFSSAQKQAIARAVGMAAIKYADLSHNIESDYVFDLDKMVALEGETGPYMLYAYARTSGIGRKAGVDFAAVGSWPRVIEMNHPSELALGKKLVQFPEVVRDLVDTLRPSLLTSYLYDLSKTFSTFYDPDTGVRIIDAQPASSRNSRLHLCDLTRRTLRCGLGLLGIGIVEEM
jgi:arginyl-tRNA synthetase